MSRLIIRSERNGRKEFKKAQNQYLNPKYLFLKQSLKIA